MLEHLFKIFSTRSHSDHSMTGDRRIIPSKRGAHCGSLALSPPQLRRLHQRRVEGAICPSLDPERKARRIPRETGSGATTELRGIAKSFTIDNVAPMHPVQTSFRILTWCCVILLAVLSLLPAQDHGAEPEFPASSSISSPMPDRRASR